MAEVFPFKGYRYNSKKVSDFNQVVTPPYDKISQEERDTYLKKNPYNIVRLILGKAEHNHKDYEQAAEYLNRWVEEDILIQDNEPGIYIYEQEYQIFGQQYTRQGFIGLGKIEENHGVKAHENTLEGPKADRLKLLQATEANFGPIFMMYSDRDQKVNKVLKSEKQQQEPLVQVKDKNDNIHRLWLIQNQERIKYIQAQMKDQTLYIADGHHRYQTALNFKQECKEKGWQGDFDRRLMTFINFNDPGLTILATHRLLYGLDDFSADRFLSEIEKDFTVKCYKDKEKMYRHLDKNKGEKNSFGFVTSERNNFWLITLAREDLLSELGIDYSSAWRELDVSVLHHGLLDNYLGIGEKELAAKKNIEYVRGRDRALEKLEGAKYQAAFILNPTPPKKVRQVADRGEKMPQKSTDFYPKLLTGLVLHKLSIQK